MSRARRWNDSARRSAANVSVQARKCPACRSTDALRKERPDEKGAVLIWCRFCSFTETKGRNAL